MQFSVLGPVQVRAGGEPLLLRRGLPRALLIYLLLQRGGPVPASVLADRLWDGAPPADAPNAVHRVVSYLRRRLAPTGETPLRTTPAGYLLDADPDAVDALLFRALVAEAAARLPPGPVATSVPPAVAGAVLEAVDRALPLWRGEPLVDVAHHAWAAAEIGSLAEAHLQAQELRLGALLALGRCREVVSEARAVVLAHPLREGFTAHLVLALYREGRQGDALAALAASRRVLREELGLDPTPELVELEQRVLRQDPALRPSGPVIPAAVPPASRPTAARWRGALPAPVTSLVGRERRLADLLAALDGAPLVTLVGPGGVGKTRLALAAVAARDDPQVWFADLAGASGDTVPAVVAAAVHARAGRGGSPDVVDAVVARLATADGMLVLDNCEHVVAAAAAFADRVRRACPGVRQLVTSRRPLGLTGEVVRPVPPLALPPPREDVDLAVAGSSPAVRLFVERATAVQPDFDLDPSTVADVAALCRTLDGLPLAIELAAAHADVLSPAAIRRRLADRFALLVGDARDVVARQRSLRAAIGSSVDLLTPAERTMFTRLGVFTGPFDLDAAAAVATPTTEDPRDPGSDPGPDRACPHGVGGDGDGADPYRLVASLVRQSLVARAGADRYRLLESIRAFAGELLAVDPCSDSVRRRHAEHFAGLAEEADVAVRSDGQDAWLRLLREGLPDLRAALAWSLDGGDSALGVRLAGALAWFWTREGLNAEACVWLERAEQAAVDADPVLRARVLRGVGLVTAPLGDLRRARDASAAARLLSLRAGDDRGALDAALTLGVALWGLGDLDGAAAAHDEAERRATLTGDLWRRAAATLLRARTAVDRGEPDAADRVAAGVALARRAGDLHQLAVALLQQAREELARGQALATENTARELIDLCQRIGYPEAEIGGLTVLARALLTADRLETDSHTGPDAGVDRIVDAERAAVAAVALARPMSHRGALCHALETLAGARSAAGRDRDALLLLDVVAADRRARGIPAPAAEAAWTARLRSTLTARPEVATGPASAATAAETIDTLADHMLRDASGPPHGAGPAASPQQRGRQPWAASSGARRTR